MARVKNLFNSNKSDRTLKADSKNLEGYAAFSKTDEEKYIQMLLTNTFGQTYYVNQKDMIKEARSLHADMAKKNPEFMAKALVYARNKGFMRSQPVYGLTFLSKVEDKPLFEEAFEQVIRTPNDLKDFYNFLEFEGRGQGGRRIKRAAGRWMVNKLNEYWVIKYGGGGNGWTVKDLIKTTHPRFGGDNQLVRYVLGKDYEVESLHKIHCFEQLKKAETAAERKHWIKEGKLPREVTTSFMRTKEEWVEAAKQMPIMALLKNLATLERHDAAEANREMIQSKFSDADLIAKSKILPFRFLDAEQKVSEGWLKDSMRDALENSFKNLPKLKGKTAIFIDVSSSMYPGWHKSGERGLIDIASIFAVALMKANGGNGYVYLFNYSSQAFHVSTRDSILTQVEKIKKIGGGGTNVSAPLIQLMNEGKKVDNIILLTDEQQNSGTPFINTLDQYKKRINANVKTFILDVSPYSQSGSLVPKDSNTFYIFGWSPKVLDFIALSERGWGSVVEAIKTGALLE